MQTFRAEHLSSSGGVLGFILTCISEKHQCSCNLKKSTPLSDAFHVSERCMSVLRIISLRVPQSVKKRLISSALDERLTGRSGVTLFILPDLRTDRNQVRGCRCRRVQVWLIHMFCPTSAYSYWGKNKVGCIIDVLTQKHRHKFTTEFCACMLLVCNHLAHRAMHLTNISLIDSLGDHTSKSYTKCNKNEK